MFGTIVEKLQALLSRSFLLGNYFPVLVFCAVNFLIMWYGVDGFSKFTAKTWQSSTAGAPSIFAAMLIAIAIPAFMINPLIPVFRLVLEGHFLPAWVRGRMISYQTEHLKELRHKLDKAASTFVAFKIEREQAEVQLGDAHDDLNPQRGSTDKKKLNDAASAIKTLSDQITVRQGKASCGARLPEMEVVKEAIQQMKGALRSYSMKENVGAFDEAISNQLAEMQFKLLRTLEEQRKLAELAMQEAAASYYERFSEGDVKPTSLANSRAAMERYPQLAYKIDFTFIWTRLGMVLSKNVAIQTAVETAAAQLDFAVLTTTLAGVTTVVWILLLPLLGGSIIPFIIVALLGPFAVLFLYHVVEASQQAFGAVAVMAIDALRFDLMSALHLPLPISLDSEQKLWERLQLALYSQSDVEAIRYRHPKS